MGGAEQHRQALRPAFCARSTGRGTGRRGGWRSWTRVVASTRRPRRHNSGSWVDRGAGAPPRGSPRVVSSPGLARRSSSRGQRLRAPSEPMVLPRPGPLARGVLAESVRGICAGVRGLRDDCDNGAAPGAGPLWGASCRWGRRRPRWCRPPADEGAPGRRHRGVEAVHPGATMLASWPPAVTFEGSSRSGSWNWGPLAGIGVLSAAILLDRRRWGHRGVRRPGMCAGKSPAHRGGRVRAPRVHPGGRHGARRWTSPWSSRGPCLSPTAHPGLGRWSATA